MTTRTNPAYATLAYRRTIIQETVRHLRETYLALSSAEPKETMHSPDVLQGDAEVPSEAIQEVIEELEQEGEHVRLEMGKFTFDKQESRANGLLSSTQAKKSSSKSRSKGRR